MRSAGVLIMILILLTQATAFVPASTAAPSQPWLTDQRTRIVRVREDAVVSIGWDRLAASGWDLASIPTAHVQVWRQGRQIPAQVTAAGISFLADGNDSPFSHEAAYWIGIGNQPGLRMFLPENPATPLIWEPDAIYQSMAGTLRGDRWFAGELRTEAEPLAAEFILPAELPIGAHIQLAITPIELRSDHQIRIMANGSPVGQLNWDDRRSGPRLLTMATSAQLAAGPVDLQIELNSTGVDVVLIDSLSIPEVALPLPQLAPPLELPRPAPPLTGADQLLIAHPELMPALGPLIAAKQQHGRTTAVADVLAIYDSYSWGERDPEAIRSFIRAVATEQPLASVLLLGAGTARMRAGPGAADPIMIPPFLLDSDPIYGEISCDSCYTRFDTADVRDDLLPNLPIGRIPARNLAEAQLMLAKTIAALSPPPGAWRSTALLVADNDQDADGRPDPAGPFSPLLAEVATGLPGIQAQSFVYAPNQSRDDGVYQHAPALRNNLFASWDAGAALVAYVGHASPWQWAWTTALEDVPYLLSRGDAVRRNGDRLPILLSMTCLSGAFSNPTLTTVDEELLRQPGGGIVAALSPAGSGVNTGHQRIVAGLLPALTAGQTLGQAHMAGLAALLAQPGDHELAFSYGILGDPDVQLPTTSFSTFLPLVTR